MKKIKITESDLYNIIKQVLLEQEEDVWYTDKEDFNFRLFKGFDGNSEKFAKSHNKFYDKIVVDGGLDLRGTPITSLPDNLHVGNDLDLYGCKNLTSLGDNLSVEDDLNLSYTPIEYLPDNLVVKGTVYIYKTPLNDNDELVNKYKEAGYKFGTY